MKKAFAFLLVLTMVLSALPMMASASYVTGLGQEGKDILAEMNDVSRAKHGFKPSAETEKHFGPSQKGPVVNNSRVAGGATLQDRINELFKTIRQVYDILGWDYAADFGDYEANALENLTAEAAGEGLDVETFVRNYTKDFKDYLAMLS